MTAAVVIACIIPAHRQPGLLPEALAAVLDQQGLPPGSVVAVVVDDGCPHPGTAAAATALAAAHPGQVFVLRQANAGLSAARNTGIAFALAAFANLRAVHCLDADNRLEPPFLARALAALDAAPPEVGWIYPDLDEFGAERSWSTAGAYSRLAHLTENACDAGGLVRAALLRQVRFDPTLRQGFEDWDFWLQAQARGWVGQHLPDAGFRYRRRPESMLKEAERERAVLVAGLRRRHAALFAPQRLLALEAAEAPRHALWMSGEGTVAWLTDPDGPATETFTPAAARARWRQALAAPPEHHHPPVLVFADAAALDALRAIGAARGVFRAATTRLAATPLLAVRVTRHAAPELVQRPRPAARLGEASLIFADAMQVGAASVRALERATAGRLDVGLPGDAASLPTSAAPLRQLLLEAAALAATPAPVPGWRREFRAPRATAAARAAAAIGVGTLLPCPPRAGARSIGFVVPIVSLGGVEQVVTSQAAVLRARGWRTHLIVLGSQRATVTAATVAAFESVSLLAGQGEHDLAPPDAGYFGAPASSFGERPGAAEAMGLLAHLDVVVNAHAAAAHPLMGPLRRLGVRTYASLHLIEQDGWGAAFGTPHAMLGWEHGYDGVLVISAALADWCRGVGIAHDTLRVLRNAPGYATAPGAAEAALAARAARAGGPLRALFLGRLDAQKGLDRLDALVAETSHAVQWRVVGRPVLGDAAPPPRLAPEPPATTPAALDALYAWADVVVLPSRFEGVPLTILEAQRMGCVVLATGVGAVHEVVTDGVDGLLVQSDLPEGGIIDGLAAALEVLARDRPRRLAIGAAARARVAGLCWEDTMAEFIAELERVIPA